MRKTVIWAASAAALWGAACEPASVTEARDILGRNGGVVSFVFPLTDTTYLVSELLADNVDTVTTPGGLLGVRVQADTVAAVTFADQLLSSALVTSVGFSAPGAAPGDPQDTLSLTTGQGTGITAATVSNGFVVRSVSNNTGCDANSDLQILDPGGATLLTFPTVLVVNGATVVDSIAANGVTMGSSVLVSASGSILGGCTSAPGTQVSSAVTVRPLTLSSVTLSNVTETIAIEDGQELDRNQLNLDDLEEAVLESALNDATIDLEIANDADIPMVIDSFYLTVVPVDAAGQFQRDGGGNLLFETDGSGNRIEALIADPGQTTFTVGRQTTSALSVNAAAVVDRALDLLLQDQRVALVVIGNAIAGDGTNATVNFGDEVEARFNMTVGLDFTIPTQGVTLERNQTADGMDLDSSDIDVIADRVILAAVSADVVNSTPFGVEIEVAIAPDSLDSSVDVFALPNAVVLSPATMAAPPTDANGLPTGSVQDSISFSISGTDSRAVLGRIFTAGLRFRLVPRTGGGTRGAIVPDAGVGITARVEIQIRRGDGS